MPAPTRPPVEQATAKRPLRTAVLLAVGSELTAGETHDTNSRDLARSLAGYGVDVAWMSDLPDRLNTVVAALREALEGADLVVTTGGLGPTPDDLTREAIAVVVGETPAVDPELERWLRHLFERRGVAFAQVNIKQAWLIPSATALPNERGTAPGWWVDRPDGRLIVALPGPPSEMRPMWEGAALPRLVERGLGREHVVTTYRLAGIGESAVATLLGEPLLRGDNPVVATYARPDGVDVRISAHAAGGRSPQEIAAPAEAAVVAALGQYVWGRDRDTWPEVLGRELDERQWSVALVEDGTAGATLRLLGEAQWLAASRLASGAGLGSGHGRGDSGAARLGSGHGRGDSGAARLGSGHGRGDSGAARGDRGARVSVADLAAEAARQSGATIGLAVRAFEDGEDTTVEIAAAGPWGVRRTRQTAFLGGSEGRRRAAVAAAAFLRSTLRDELGRRG
jgi:nicotinamide-nucleotide amidase